MKKRILLFTVSIVWLLFFMAPASSHAAAFSDSSAWIDWSSLTFSGININWTYGYSSSYAYTEDDLGNGGDDYDSEDSWGDTYASASITAPLGSASAEAATDQNQLYEGVQAKSMGGDYNPYSWAEAWRGGDFEALEAGELTISVDYYLEQDLDTEYFGEMADAGSFAWLFLQNMTTDDETADQDELWNIVYDGDSGLWESQGTLTVTLYFNKGDSGGFETYVSNDAEAYSPTPVPEPCTILLLSSGLAGLMGFGGRRFLRA